MIFDYKAIENIIGYSFCDKSLLLNAFTHKSFTNEHKDYPCYERLEFLGDSVLGFIVTDYLFKTYDQPEGKLTKLKSEIVSTLPLSAVFSDEGLDEFVLCGNGVELSDNRKIKEDVFEALIGAIYLDGGLKAAQKFVIRFLVNSKSLKKSIDLDTDYKSQVKVFTEKRKLGEVTYEEIERRGPDHKPVFIIALMLDGKELSSGEGTSKQKAEQDAARSALQKLKSEGF